MCGCVCVCVEVCVCGGVCVWRCVCVEVCVCRWGYVLVMCSILCSSIFPGLEPSGASEWGQCCPAANCSCAAAAGRRPHPAGRRPHPPHPLRAAGACYSYVLNARQPLLCRSQGGRGAKSNVASHGRDWWRLGFMSHLGCPGYADTEAATM